MATLDELSQQVNSNTTKINSISDNSKTITELSPKAVIDGTEELAIAGEEKITSQQIVNLAQTSATITVSHPILVPFDFPINTKTDLNSIHGSLLINDTEDGIILNSTTPIIGVGGVSKVMAAVLAGTDLVGSFTITGTSVDRNTGVETTSDTETVIVNGLTTNTSATDSNGNTVYGYSNAYLSSKWWKGTLTFSTTDLNLTEIRFAQLSFEQFNDSPGITVDTFDSTYKTTNVTAEMDAYLYAVTRGINNIVNVSVISELHHESGLPADNSYRRRKGNIAQDLDGTSEGIFIDLYLNPATQQYFSSFACKVWATKTETVSVVYS